MNEVEIDAWVSQAPQGQRGFREAVHTILDGIGHSQNLSAKMVMKGGLLLAIRYASSRYTRDLDFSTRDKYTAESVDLLLAELREGLVTAEDRLSYDTLCRLQSHKVEPKGENKTHQSLALKIGFANRSNAGQMARLEAGISPQVVEIDYSFNEAVFDVEVLALDGGATIHSYTLNNVLAEKMRSLLQQPVRRRNRRQDVYDIAFLIDDHDFSDDDKATILATLIEKCRSRGIDARQDSMDNPEIKQRAQADWDTLALVIGDLPPFDERFALMRDLYTSLPWVISA